MIGRALHIALSLWLAALLLFGMTPKDVIHACADHIDTVHRQDVQGPVAEAAHHHCSFLAFELMPFGAPPALPLLRPAPLPGHITFLPVQDARACQQAIALREGRGPPAA